MSGQPRRFRWTLLGGAVIALTANLTALSPARAGSMSFTGTFRFDNDIQLLPFTVSTTSDVTLETWSYAGGTNAAGQVIPAGGFDVAVSLFDPSGKLIGSNDDGIGVATDPTTGDAFDARLEVRGLAPGEYTAAVTQYGNFANGPTLADGFSAGSNTNYSLAFAPPGASGYFWDVTQNERTGNWALDIVTAKSARTATSPIPGAAVPEPSALLLGGMGLMAALGLAAKSRTKPAV